MDSRYVWEGGGLGLIFERVRVYSYVRVEEEWFSGLLFFILIYRFQVIKDGIQNLVSNNLGVLEGKC